MRPSGVMMCACSSVCWPGLEQRERAAGELVVVPHLGGADFELLDDLRMDLRHVVERLHDAIGGRERSPALRVLGPRVAGEQHAAAGFAAVLGIEHVADRQVGDGPAAEDAFVLFPEPAPALEQDLGRRVVVELADRLLLAAARTASGISTWRSTANGTVMIA